MPKGYDPCPSEAKFSSPVGAAGRPGPLRVPGGPRRLRRARRAACARSSCHSPQLTGRRAAVARPDFGVLVPLVVLVLVVARFGAARGSDLPGASTRRSCVVTSGVSPGGMTVIPPFVAQADRGYPDPLPSLLASNFARFARSSPRIPGSRPFAPGEQLARCARLVAAGVIGCDLSRQRSKSQPFNGELGPKSVLVDWVVVMPSSAYLDHAATTPMRPEAVAAMAPVPGGRLRQPLGWARGGPGGQDRARRGPGEVAGLLGARPAEVVFTAGGTEADNLAVKGAARARARPAAATASSRRASSTRRSSRRATVWSAKGSGSRGSGPVATGSSTSTRSPRRSTTAPWSSR